jgi:hypothetical protein
MKLTSLLPILVLATAAAFAVPANAQIGISGAFTGATVSQSGSSSPVYGPTISFYAEHGAALALGGDIRASFLNGNGRTFNSGAIGPRAAIKLHPLPLQIYGEALAGFNSFKSPTVPSSTHIDYQLLGGVDATVFPHVDWRVFEYDYTSSSDSLAAHSFSTGLVIRIPY